MKVEIDLLRKTGNEKFSNLSKNLRGKPHQQNTRGRRKNLRHWGQDRRNGYFSQENVKSKNNSGTKHSENNGTIWKDQIYEF